MESEYEGEYRCENTINIVYLRYEYQNRLSDIKESILKIQVWGRI